MSFATCFLLIKFEMLTLEFLTKYCLGFDEDFFAKEFLLRKKTHYFPKTKTKNDVIKLFAKINLLS